MPKRDMLHLKQLVRVSEILQNLCRPAEVAVSGDFDEINICFPVKLHMCLYNILSALQLPGIMTPEASGNIIGFLVVQCS